MTKQVRCDYCGSLNEAKSVCSAQKSFVGHKIHDVLQIITHKTLPANLGVKVCSMCAFNLMTTMGVIQKTQTMVENASLTTTGAAGKNKKAANKAEQSEDPIVDLTAEGDIKSIQTKTAALPKNVKMRPRSKSMAASSSDLIFPESEVNASPSKKTPKKNTSRPEDGLEESVRLTPAKEVAPVKKVFYQLFGSSNGVAPESDEEEDDDEATDEPTDKVVLFNNDFDCRQCNFQTRSEKLFKKHLQQEHGQQRPRIYFCKDCTKNFGILKSLKAHMEKVHGKTVEMPQKEAKRKVATAKEQQTKDTNEDQKEKPLKDSSSKPNVKEVVEDQEPKLATIKALNGEAAAKKKLLKNANADYTFAVNGSSTSTPKAADKSSELSNNFKCDICDSVLATAKQMKEHMKTAHQIDKPKLYKCHVCEKSLTTKQTLKHHMQHLHNEGAEAEKSSKRKLLQEEIDVDNVESITKKSPVEKEEDDEKPQEEKIRHTENEESKAADDSLMAPPKTPSKKAKKVKNLNGLDVSQIEDSPTKKGKRKSKENTSLNKSHAIDLLEEINTNVKPHKKARLDSSASESVCSSIDGYSTADESALSCNRCGKQVKSQERLVLHIQKRHSTRLVCPGCQTIYQSQKDYVNHFEMCSSGASLLPCGVENCKKSFYEANYLSAHLRIKHQWA